MYLCAKRRKWRGRGNEERRGGRERKGGREGRGVGRWKMLNLSTDVRSSLSFEIFKSFGLFVFSFGVSTRLSSTVRISFLGQGLTDDIILQFGLSSFFAEDDFSRLFTDHERWWIEEWRIVLARLIPSTFAAFHRNFSDRKEEREIPLNIIIIITIITYNISL